MTASPAADPPPADPPPGRTAGPPLPPRPRLVPGRTAVRRGSDAVQFGTDPDAALVLDGLTPPLRRMVGALDGTRRAIEVIADAVAAGVAPGPAHAVLSTMDAAGLLGGAPHESPCSRTVLVHGGGRLAVALAGALAAAPGVAAVRVVAHGPVRADDIGTGLAAADVGRPASDAVADVLARAVPGVRAGSSGAPDLIVIAQGAAPDPGLAADLHGRGRSHLVVAIRDGVGLVGPLVRPGDGPCAWCAELARADEDPAWPTTLAQLTTGGPAPDVATATATAALAAAQVRMAIAADGAATSHRVPAHGAVLELDPRGASLRRVVVPVHPECRCRRGSPPLALSRSSATGRDRRTPQRNVTVARVA